MSSTRYRDLAAANTFALVFREVWNNSKLKLRDTCCKPQMCQLMITLSTLGNRGSGRCMFVRSAVQYAVASELQPFRIAVKLRKLSRSCDLEGMRKGCADSRRTQLGRSGVLGTNPRSSERKENEENFPGGWSERHSAIMHTWSPGFSGQLRTLAMPPSTIPLDRAGQHCVYHRRCGCHYQR